MRPEPPPCRRALVAAPVLAALAALAVLAAAIGCDGRAAAAGGLDKIRLPPGFAIEVWAEGLSAVRSLEVSPSGTVFAGSDSGKVWAIVPGKGGRAGKTVTVAGGLDSPHGVAFHEGALYVAEMTRVLRFPDVESRLGGELRAEVAFHGLPDRRHHGRRAIGFGPDGKLYVSIGAPCNVCETEGTPFGSIVRVKLGEKPEIFARGIRDSVGFDWHPETKELWFTDNGRDMLGDDRPPDELGRAPKPGMHFGFPYCHGADLADPQFGTVRPCSELTPPAQALGPHVAALGMRFYVGEQFPAEWRGRIFVAEHGSWNRSRKVGYRVTTVKLEGGRAVAYEPFAEGGLEGESVSGRPVDVEIAADGSLYVSDDHADRIYRISWKG